MVGSIEKFQSSLLSNSRDNGANVLEDGIFQKRLASLILNHRYCKSLCVQLHFKRKVLETPYGQYLSYKVQISFPKKKKSF
jgi:hypothetical protein